MAFLLRIGQGLILSDDATFPFALRVTSAAGAMPQPHFRCDGGLGKIHLGCVPRAGSPDNSRRSSTRIGSESSMLLSKERNSFHHRRRCTSRDNMLSHAKPWRASAPCLWPARKSSRISSVARGNTMLRILPMKAPSPPGAVRDSMPISRASSKASTRSPFRIRCAISALAFVTAHAGAPLVHG